MGRRGPKPKSAPPPAPLKPKGKGPIKRTSTSTFDAAAKDDDVYQCEAVGQGQDARAPPLRRVQHGLSDRHALCLLRFFGGW